MGKLLTYPAILFKCSYQHKVVFFPKKKKNTLKFLSESRR